MQLRDYQLDVLGQLKAAASNDLVQLDTGAGKTPIEAALAGWAPHCMLVAHRVTLIRQLSEKLAAFGLDHDTVSPDSVRRRCALAHRGHGRMHITRGHARRLVVSIDSLRPQLERGRLAHVDLRAPWLIVIDEAHHAIPDNKWGALRELMPNARIVGFTATPARLDGESLHVSKGGLFERLVQAGSLGDDSARVLIERGYLSDFVVYAPPRGALEPRAAAWGLDYASGELELEADPVQEYLRRASGTRAIVMAPAIANAEQLEQQFRERGVSAAAIHSAMPASSVTRALDAFERGELRVLCNVDMVGEGFDLPAVQTLIIATRTASLPRYRQWVGRVLRPAPGKKRAIVIDLTRQVEAHGMPDAPIRWDLLNPPIGPVSRTEAPCDSCGAYFNALRRACPHCGARNGPLLDATPLGNFVFDLRVLPRGLIEQERATIATERAAERRAREVIWPHFAEGGGLLLRTVGELRRWYVAALQTARVTCGEINDFLESPEAADVTWWMERFTAADMRTRGAAKAKKVHTAWRKQRA